MKEWHSYDMEDPDVVRRLTAKLHHNTGCFPWRNFSTFLRVAKVPQAIYDEAKKHCEKCDRTRVTGPRPLSRPAAFPTATAPFEVVLMDFFWWKQVEVLHIIDAFSRFTVLKVLRSVDKGKPLDAAERVVECLTTSWIAYFGTPRVLHIDPDVRFKNRVVQTFCDDFHITLLQTPPRHHQSFGVVERHHAPIKQCLTEMTEKGAFGKLPLSELIAVVQLIHNQHISQTDGSTPGHRVFGRAPRLPVPATERADFGGVHHASFGIIAPETRTMLVTKAIADCRARWLEADTRAKCAKAISHKDRAVKDEDIFIRQTVYFYHQPSKGVPG